MIMKVRSKEYAITAATDRDISWGESEVDHCLYVGDIDSLKAAGVKIGIRSVKKNEPPNETQKLRRYQIILPEAKNDGSPFDPRLLSKTIEWLISHYGGGTVERNSISGYWHGNTGVVAEKNVRLTCDVPDTPENLEFFLQFKKVNQDRFEQEEIWLTSFPIERIL